MKWLPFEFALALRYLRPKRTSVSFITLISVVGVMLGVAVLIIVTSVFSGFHLQLKKSFFQFSADLTVRPLGGPIVEYEALSDRIAKIPGVTGVSPIIGGKVMMETDPKIGAPAFDAPVLLGVDPERMKTVSQVPDNLEAGEFNLRGNRLVIGYNFARLDGEFRLQVGDRVLIHSPKSIQEMRESQQAGEELGIFPEEYIVAGVFDAGQKDLNDFIFCSLYNAQDLYGLEEGAAMLWVETTDPLELDPQQAALGKLLGEGYRVGTWKDLNPVLLAQVQVEKMINQFLMFFIVVVAAFGIASSLIIFGVQKTKEIGLLKALGASNGQVSFVFLIQSAVVGVLGTGMGIAMGLLVLKYRNQFLGFLRGHDVELFPEKLYGFRELPAQVVPGDLVVICGVSVLICLVAGLLPAWNAARLRPVEALRSE
ncbi:MAG: ABC transporter permease [Verrucomicrobiota bacterium]|jgi:lipoprotein-releasing system permease protein|nr:ABC transporter permease [Verrucomicrobiota bacterium]